MFDDLNEKNLDDKPIQPEIKKIFPNSSASGQNGPIEDIFADSNLEPQKPEAFQAKVTTTPDELNIEEASSDTVKKILLLAGILIVFVSLIAAGWYGYQKFFVTEGGTEQDQQNNDENKVIELENTLSNDNANNADPAVIPQEQNNNTVSPVIEDNGIDSDGDGLTDAEEAAANTDANLIDTDGDGLFDREEIKVYGTDPTKQDTDGDTFSDGSEVKNNYNPKGEGRLFQIR